MGKKYGYYEEISQLRSLNIQIHNFYDEQPPKDEYVVVLYYTADDPFDPKETWTERMWQEPFLLTRDICGGDEEGEKGGGYEQRSAPGGAASH